MGLAQPASDRSAGAAGPGLLRVADPAGAWQLELHMPENHMGHVTGYQQTLYEQVARSCAELLQEEARAKLGEAATQEDVDKAVGRRHWPKCPTKSCTTRWPPIFQQRLRAGIEPILKDVTDEKLRAKLGEVLHEKTYDAEPARSWTLC